MPRPCSKPASDRKRNFKVRPRQSASLSNSLSVGLWMVASASIVTATTGSGRIALRGDLMRDHHLTWEQAERWCVAWREHAVSEGIEPGPYFWDSARGWVDAALAVDVSAPKKTRRRRRKRVELVEAGPVLT